MKDPCWPVLYNGRDSAGVLTDLMEKLWLEGRKNLEYICLLTSWLLFSLSQSWTQGQLASQPFQVATFSRFGILLESQSPHCAGPDFIQIHKRKEPSLPRARSHQVLEPLGLWSWDRGRASGWGSRRQYRVTLRKHSSCFGYPFSDSLNLYPLPPLALSLYSLWHRLLVSATSESPLPPRHTGRWHFLPPQVRWGHMTCSG